MNDSKLNALVREQLYDCELAIMEVNDAIERKLTDIENTLPRPCIIGDKQVWRKTCDVDIDKIRRLLWAGFNFLEKAQLCFATLHQYSERYQYGELNGWISDLEEWIYEQRALFIAGHEVCMDEERFERYRESVKEIIATTSREELEYSFLEYRIGHPDFIDM